MTRLAVLFAQAAPEAVWRPIGMPLSLEGAGGVVVETEADEARSPASHSVIGRTHKNAEMFCLIDVAYACRVHDLHRCLDFACDAGTGPRGSDPRPRPRNRDEDPAPAPVARRQLRAALGRLCQDLRVTAGFDRAALDQPALALTPTLSRPSIVTGPRFGSARNTKRRWRFRLGGSVASALPLRRQVERLWRLPVCP